ncbi:methyl-accepting chemotaxis protein [Endozoicomonas atrinae]|uniref:methyl-accepting chemotaxis protein n=1 Tax=Endozoicomonas atrinae TaxID=1333660 RepID=UPI000ABCACFD|nr:methyl-accepting chemotaxis protein [Endozoicomonas atrinae]
MNFWNRLDFKKKLLVVITLCSLIPSLVISVFSLGVKVEALENDAFQHLEAVRTIKAHQIQKQIQKNKQEIETLADQLEVHITLNGLEKTINYFEENGLRVFSRYIKRNGYDEIYLFDAKGFCFFTVEHGSEYQTNLLTGSDRDSGLGDVVRGALKSGSFHMVDFAPYAPSGGKPAAFIAIPVMSEGQAVMVLALKLSVHTIDEVMTERTGMGETGETYLVGSDKLMRSDSFKDPVYHSVDASFEHPVRGKVDTAAVHDVFEGQTGSKIIHDFNGTEVLSAYEPVQVSDNVTWAILAEIDVSEAFLPLHEAQRTMFVIVCVSALLIILIALLLARVIAKPIKTMSDTMVAVQQTGKLSMRLPVVSKDETGQAAMAFNKMLEGQQNIIAEVHEVMASVSSGDFSKRVELDACGDFDTLKTGTNQMADSLSKIVDDVQKSCVQLSSTAVNISATTKEQAASAKEQEATTHEIMATSQGISQTSRELVSNMDEVARAVDDTSELAEQGHEGLTRMRGTVEQMVSASQNISDKLAVLNEKAGKINVVVTTINKIADQTNLLSVNAAIEADKAGEFGVGFSTVATEIRRLADQTAVATYDIEEMVKEMQAAVSAGVMGMEKFSDEIRQGVDETCRVSDQLSQIVEKVQTLAPHFESVHQGMRSQSDGAEQIQEALSQLGETIRNLNDSMRISNNVVENLNDESERLKQSVVSFQVDGEMPH